MAGKLISVVINAFCTYILKALNLLKCSSFVLIDLLNYIGSDGPESHVK